MSDPLPQLVVLIMAACSLFVCGVVTATSSSPHTGCCYADQYEGKLYMTQGKFDKGKNQATLTTTDSTIHYDLHRQMVVLNSVQTTMPATTKRTYRLIEDFTKKQSWYIEGPHCYKIPLTAPLTPPCLPAGSTLEGSYDVAGIPAQTWILPPANKTSSSSSSTPTPTLTRLTAATKGCTPIALTKVTFGDISTMLTVQYGNLTKGIADPAVFNIPSSCT